MSDHTPQRSALYVPASNRRAVEKSASIEADWLIYDLEDSVSIEEKPAARETLLEVFSKREFGASRAAIRCNAIASDAFKADIKTIAACRPDAVLIPKVESVEDVRQFSELASAAALSETTGIWFMIETANGIVRLGEILESAHTINWTLTTLVVGHNDIASETGVSLDHDRKFLIPWLMQIVLHAKAQDLQVLDSVWNNFRDPVGFEKEATNAKQMGFDGKTLIHPSQVDSARRIFSPTEDEVDRAKRIVDEFLKTENLRKNVLNIDGEMVERLHLLQAQRLLGKAGL